MIRVERGCLWRRRRLPCNCGGALDALLLNSEALFESLGGKMRAHYMQHVPFEGPGQIESWLQQAGYEISRTRLFESAELPDPHEIDLLIVLGGPMSVTDEAAFPWLVAEKELIREAVRGNKPVLGICLGAQLIASAMGARVYPNHTKEIGWFPIQGVPAAKDSIFCFPPTVEVFHWHGETFDLPSGAVLLARSEGCENQAFQLGSSAIGLQFHLEMTPEAVWQMVQHGRAELIPARYVQPESAILSVPTEKYGAIHRLLDQVLSFITKKQG